MFLFTASSQVPPQLLGNSPLEAAAQFPFEMFFQGGKKKELQGVAKPVANIMARLAAWMSMFSLHLISFMNVPECWSAAPMNDFKILKSDIWHHVACGCLSEVSGLSVLGFYSLPSSGQTPPNAALWGRTGTKPWWL